MAFSFLGWIRSKFRATKISLVPPRDPAITALFKMDGADSDAGVEVDEDTAKQISAYWSGINLIATTVASIPCHYYDKDDKGLKISNGTYETLVNQSPNAEMTPFTFQSLILTHALGWGNFYAEILNKGEKGVTLDPLHPSRVRTEMIDGKKVHFVTEEQGENENGDKSEDKERKVSDENMIHVFGLSEDGIVGLSPIKYFQRTLGIAKATDTFAAKFYKQGAVTSGVVSHPLDLGPDGAKRLEQKINSKIGSVENAHRLLVLDEGMKYTQTSIPPDDAQFLETRRFSVLEIARILRIPPHMLYEMDNTTQGNLEQQNLGYFVYTVFPWTTRIEQEYDKKLRGIDPAEQNCFGFDPSRMQTQTVDMKTRFDAYSTARNNGWYTLNRIAELERMPKLAPEIGDTHLAPSTMKTLEQTDGRDPVDMDELAKMIELLKASNSREPNIIRDALVGAFPQARVTLVKAIVRIITNSDPTDDEEPIVNPKPFAKERSR